MQYKTIALELLKQLPENPSINESLHSRMEKLALRLKEIHLSIYVQMVEREPNQPVQLLKSQAMELAIQEIREGLENP